MRTARPSPLTKTDLCFPSQTQAIDQFTHTRVERFRHFVHRQCWLLFCEYYGLGFDWHFPPPRELLKAIPLSFVSQSTLVTGSPLGPNFTSPLPALQPTPGCMLHQTIGFLLKVDQLPPGTQYFLKELPFQRSDALFCNRPPLH